jgi:hypothetical protein
MPTRTGSVRCRRAREGAHRRAHIGGRAQAGAHRRARIGGRTSAGAHPQEHTGGRGYGGLSFMSAVESEASTGETPTDAASIYSRALAPFLRDTERLLPSGAEIIDAHTHLGMDEDGRSLDLAGLLHALDSAGVGRACTFPLHDPERRPAYRLPNDRVLAWAAESEGRLVPFCRLDPLDDPLAEATRCLRAGARGIKLHPRAQAFTFGGNELRDALDGIFAIAEEASVPILIHAGRGLPPLADGLVELALRHPGAPLILAHGAICDQGTLTSGLTGHPAALYDTSCFYPIDVLALLARVPAERIVLGSDPPYGHPSSGLYLALRAACSATLGEATTRLVVGGTMAALLDGKPLPAAQPPRAPDSLTISRRLARVYGYASAAGPALFAGAQERAREALDLALSACRDPEPGEDGETLAAIGDALGAAVALLASKSALRPAIDLIHRSMALAATATAGPGAPERATPPPPPARATAQPSHRARGARARAAADAT